MAQPTRTLAPRPLPSIADGIDDLVGNTPLLRLPVAHRAPGAEVLAKLECANPAASVNRPADPRRWPGWPEDQGDGGGEQQPGGGQPAA
ncbi:hypothetical protein AB0M60_09200, partial [Micromonospora wenchangensis]